MNKTKIWQAGSTKLHPLVEQFTVGEDHLLDQELVPYDVQASLAHATMLQQIGVLSPQELQTVQQGLKGILKDWQSGNFIIRQEQEDCHTAIEQSLTEKYGEVGKKIHTGRSRNDQSLVMLRLFMKAKLEELTPATSKLSEAFQNKATEFAGVAMPGYTHLQKAMPTTVDTWLGSFADAITDYLPILESTLNLIDQNPLGSASGFGIENFPMQRSITTEKLGFHKTQINPMYCGLSRGYFEGIVLQSLIPLMTLAAKFANDMLLFSTQEFGFVSLPPNFTTGSSIMPQKRNYDIFEIMRGNIKVFTAYQQEIQSIVASIGSSYQRDLQLTKKPFILGINLCTLTLSVLTEAVRNLKVDQEALSAAMTPDLYVTNSVYDLVNQGMTFRQAYQQVKQEWYKD